MSNATRFIQVAENLVVFAMLMIAVIGTSIIAPGFFTYTNLTNALIAASIAAVTSLGMTFAVALRSNAIARIAFSAALVLNSKIG